MSEIEWKHPLHIKHEYWKDMSEEELEFFITQIFQYYRNVRRFPFYSLNLEERYKEFNKLLEYDYRNVLDGKVIKQTMHGLALAWSYFPHSWNVPCRNMKTPMEVYKDDDLFRKAIRRRLKRGVYITDGGIRKGLKSYTGVQAVSNFRPTAAGAIYEHFAGDGVVWDMSAGFGGRLIGALTSERVKTYIGTDPSTKTYNGLKKIMKDYRMMYQSFHEYDKEVRLFKLGSENYLPDENSLDLCFTSPPYFDTEKYSKEKTQSYIKFPTRNDWFNGFLDRTIANCIHGLKRNGYLIINISKVVSYPELEQDMLTIFNLEPKLELVEKLDYLLSSLQKGGYKSEPVYVFRVNK